MNNENDKKESGDGMMYMPLGMCLGMAIGTAIGVATDNMSMWMVMGMSIGLSLGVAIDSFAKSKKKENGESDLRTEEDQEE